MKTVTVTKARAELYRLLVDASSSHEPIQITGKRSKAVLISEEDWRAIQETRYLLSNPGMRESICGPLKGRGLACPKSKCQGQTPTILKGTEK